MFAICELHNVQNDVGGMAHSVKELCGQLVTSAIQVRVGDDSNDMEVVINGGLSGFPSVQDIENAHCH